MSQHTNDKNKPLHLLLRENPMNMFKQRFGRRNAGACFILEMKKTSDSCLSAVDALDWCVVKQTISVKTDVNVIY